MRKDMFGMCDICDYLMLVIVGYGKVVIVFLHQLFTVPTKLEEEVEDEVVIEEQAASDI